MTLKNIIVGGLFAVLLFLAAFIPSYWYLDPGYIFATPPQQVINQVEGTSMAVSVPIEDYVDVVDSLSIYTQVTDMAGTVVQRTPPLTPYPKEHYRVITHSKLPVGDFYIVLCVVYRSNPIKWQLAQVPLGILHVIDKDKK